jgi:hypothetical protein
MTAPGRCELAVESLYINRCDFTERTVCNGAARLNGIFHRQSLSIRMHCAYGCSVHSHWSCSVQPVVGRETPRDMESKQVSEASSNALQEIYDRLSALSHMTISDMKLPSNRTFKKWFNSNEIIYIPAGLEKHLESYPHGINVYIHL